MLPGYGAVRDWSRALEASCETADVPRGLFKSLVKTAGMPVSPERPGRKSAPMTFHDMRHTCASLLLAARVQPLVVSRLIGHKNVLVTLGTYGHMMPSQDSDASDAMERLLA